MKTSKKISFMLVGVVALIAIVAGVFAHQGNYGNSIDGSNHQRGMYHEDLSEVLESGTFEDLEAYREEIGFDVMRKVQSQEDFDEMKQRHQEMQEQGIEPGYLRNNRGKHFVDNSRPREGCMQR